MNERIDPGRAPGELELIAFAEGRIDADALRGREIAAWLQTQPQARQRVDGYVRQDRAIRAAFASKLGEPVPARLRLATIRRRRDRACRRWTGGVAAMTAGAAVLVLAMRPESPARGDSLEVFAQTVLEQIETDAPPAWNVAVAAQVSPVFIPGTFELAGARRMETSGGVVTEQLYRDADGRSLRLFIGEEPPPAAAAPRWRQVGGQQLVYWESGDRHYALSGGIDATELQQLAARAMQAPAEPLRLASEAVPEPAVAETIESVTLPPETAQPVGATPAMGIDPLGQIEMPPAAEQQPL